MRTLHLSSLAGLALFAACGGRVEPENTPSARQALSGGGGRSLSTCTAADQQSSPVISGTRVVWTEVFSGPPANFDLTAGDIFSGTTTNITNSPNDQEFLQALDGDMLVYTHTSAGIAGDIVAYDFAHPWLISTIASATLDVHYELPSIGGRIATLVRVGSTTTDIVYYDFDNGPAFVTTDAAFDYGPRTDGSLIVYTSSTASFRGPGNVVGWSIATQGPPFVIATNAVEETFPDVDGGVVVWNAPVGGSDQIFLYDTATRTTTQLTTASGAKTGPRISGGRVVWADQRSGDLDVWGYDIAARAEVPVVTGPGDQYLPDIDGSNVVYTTNAGGCEQVAFVTFPPAPPPPPSVVGTSNDVEGFFASGDIKNAGIENALLSKLAAAAAKRAVGDCTGAAEIYQAFINSVQAQAGKGISSAAATKLIADAQYLIAHCP